MKNALRNLLRIALAVAALAWTSHTLAVSNVSAVAPPSGKQVIVEAFRMTPGGEAPTMLTLDRIAEAEILAVREANSLAETKRLQIGIGRDVPFSVEAGSAALSWASVEGGLAAQWRVTSPGAHALRIGLEAARFPASAQLRFAGDNASTTVYGPFTAADLATGAPTYWSPVLEGESAIVEVFIPQSARTDGVSLAISQVSHLFVSPTDPNVDALAKASQACEVNLICLSASNAALASVGKAVAKMTFNVGAGSFLCTGTLLNPNGGSFTPYFYSAAHCMSTQADASTLTTHWFYDATACAGTTPGASYVQVTGGATLLYVNTTTDVLFLRLNSTPPAAAVYAGWDAATLANGTALTGVHHPAGDIKKVSLATMGGFSAYGGGAGSDHLIALWNGTATGVTEGGSSGSGIFSGNSGTGYALRGGLHGGPSTCTATGTALRDYYSRFDQAFPFISQWLNPTTTTFTLGVTLAGTGTGTVTSSPAGISCGATCSASFNSGTQVTLTAAALSGSVFSGWSGGGACSGTGSCIVTLSAALTVTATFTASGASNPPRLGNISTRMQVLTGNDVMIGGFVIGGATPKTVVVRARGPSLIPFGITNALADPQLTLYSGQTVIASNDDWGSAANAAAITSSGFAPSNGFESAILVTLNPGAYTAIVSGFGNSTGVGIVEVFAQ